MDEAHSLHADGPDIAPYVRTGSYANFKTLKTQYWMAFHGEERWIEVTRPSIFEKNYLPTKSSWRRKCCFEGIQGNARVTGSCIDYFSGSYRHREKGPARIIRTGDFVVLEYRRNGGQHREDGPAVMMFQGGKLMYEQWCRSGRTSRLDGPALIYNGQLQGHPAEQLANFVLQPGVPISEWYVDARHAKDFSKYFNSDDPGESILRCVKDHPDNCLALIKIGIANNWLNQDQVGVLDALNTFGRTI